ncbi:hypothetical protein CONLIGDRAFT_657605 [Coniochaeta ligniaria NRRL 30616]|uniref:Sorting nexin-4 n=1 Tax=Coniochaeta ligniaria NRRL 30616 TaxID=1408157 RepID=A0A1J7J4K8_9PEZI|nr:hypothetical protein CONLIGDRAFT_657605 [Coniochaeta ligniaria NRRL 30616]
MAKMDPNDFSNVSWHSEQNAGGQPAPSGASESNKSGPATPDFEASRQEARRERSDEPGHAGEILECIVSEPHKENDGTKDAYVSYMITTHTTFPSFQKPTVTVRRRFTDFLFLYKSLYASFPGAAVPPLPDKQRMEYVRGDRFGADFTSRRAYSLQRFLTRLALHPELRKAPILHIFLESPDWNATMRSTGTRTSRGMSGASPVSETPPGGGNGGVFDAFTDGLINAFTKVHKPDRRFIEVKERSDKLDEDLGHVEKVMVRVARRETDLESDLRDLAEQFQKLIVLEPGVDAAAHAFAASVEDSAAGLKKLQHLTEADYVGSLRDMAAYGGALKALLKLREQKQLDYEQLTEYLNKSTAERDAGAAGYGGYGGYSVTGAGGFIRSKIEDVRGVDHEQSRRDRQRKLELRIDELTREVESARREADHFADQVVHETQNFEWIKRVEFRRQFGGLADAHVEFYDGIAGTWERYVLEMEREGVVLPA